MMRRDASAPDVWVWRSRLWPGWQKALACVWPQMVVTWQHKRAQLKRIELPNKYTVVMQFKTPLWEVPSHFAQFNGYQNITSKKYLETVGEEQAAQHPISTKSFQHV